MKARYLTKTHFKLATECPTKLFYTGKENLYPDNKTDDSFLEELAEGGFQVGELAKCYHPEGHEITSPDYIEAEKQTLELLKRDNVTIFEPAIRFENLFIRVDILVKNGDSLQIIEVKGKSYSANSDREFLNKKGDKITADWKPYLYDIAFQKHVVNKAFPSSTVSSYLMLVNKEVKAGTSGLNQKFRIVKDASNQKGAIISNTLNDDDLQKKLLITINTDEAVRIVYDTELTSGYPGMSFLENIEEFAIHYANDDRIAPVIGKKCKSCEFRCTPQQESEGLISGFKACWKEQLHWNDADFEEPTVLDISNYRKADECIERGVIKLSQFTQDDIGDGESPLPALSTKERQWLQVEKAQNRDASVYFDCDSMREFMNDWIYPLHFIDFETSAVAIPFYEGMRPYEGIAFQFSHHVVYDDGRVEHVGEYLNTNPGEFPNFKFVRELKKQLEKDAGTIFRYASHENTYLNKIYQQLKKSEEADREELCQFIMSITKSTDSSDETWIGERVMVDLLELVKYYYYDPATNGSNSIKHVLPAVLNSSNYLQRKYSQPVYGSAEIPSRNFNEHTWLEFDDDGGIVDPYKLLPRMFTDAAEHNIELMSEADELNNGGMALTAYARLQFTEMSAYEREELEKALSKYCELDTMAMVMIFEAWRDWVENGIEPSSC